MPFVIFRDQKCRAVILRDLIYSQELTTHIFIDLASHVGLILPLKHCQQGFITKELDLLVVITVATKAQKLVTKSF